MCSSPSSSRARQRMEEVLPVPCLEGKEGRNIMYKYDKKQ